MSTNGADYLIQINTGTPETPEYTTIACQTGASISETNDVIDASCKSARERKVLAGRYSSTLQLDTLVDFPLGDGYKALQDAMRNGTKVKIQTEIAGTATESASAIVSSLSTEAPDQDNVTFSATFEIDGAWTAAA